MIPEQFTFKYLKARVSIAAVLQDKGINTAFTKRADQLFGPCPVHKRGRWFQNDLNIFLYLW